jgi:hypothetical protein
MSLSKKQALAKAATLSYEIYALVDPRDMTPRYVGRSVDARKRMTGHLGTSSMNSNIGKRAWIAELRRTGRDPQLVILSRVVGALNAVECEQFWVDHGRVRGWPLLNAKGSRFGGNLGLGRNARETGRYWTLEALGMEPRRWSPT